MCFEKLTDRDGENGFNASFVSMQRMLWVVVYGLEKVINLMNIGGCLVT